MKEGLFRGFIVYFGIFWVGGFCFFVKATSAYNLQRQERPGSGRAKPPSASPGPPRPAAPAAAARWQPALAEPPGGPFRAVAAG